MSRKPIYLASKDGVGHVRVKGGALRTLCGMPSVLERLSYPVERICQTCRRLAMPDQPVLEGDHRA